MRKIFSRAKHKGNKAALYLGLILLLVSVVTTCLPLVAGKAQTHVGSVDTVQSSGGAKVIVKSDSGSVITSSAQSPNTRTVAGLRNLVQRYDGTWKVDIENGVVKNLSPVATVNVASSPKDFSREFLSEFSTLFGIPSSETSYITEFSLRERRVVEYRQEINGVPVEYSFLTFSVADSQLEQITSRVYPVAGESLKGAGTAIEKEEAYSIASSDAVGKSTNKEQFNFAGELVILPEGGAYFLSWKVIASAQKSLASYTYYIDALTGRVLKKFSNLKSQERIKSKDVPAGLMSKQEETHAVLKRMSPPQTSLSGAERDNDGKSAHSDQPSTKTPLPQAQAAWQTILSENFDVKEFPYSPWRAYDNNGSTGGQVYWDDQNCVSHDPSWSLWAADGGTNRLNPCTDNYANNMDSWTDYGPFDMSNTTDGIFEFHVNNVSELNYDHFKWMVSVDGTNFYGFQISGNTNGWQYKSLDLKNVPTLGNITGRSQVWIAFIFTSDGSVTPGKGAFVDDVAVKKLVSSQCTGVSGHVGGHIYGKNKNELQLKDFKNMKVVLNNSFATDAHAVTNSVGNYSSTACSDSVRFELEGFGNNNFLKVRDCNDGTCPLGGDLLTSQEFSFAQLINYDWNEDAEDKKEVNVFWHVNEMHDWFRSLLGQDLMNYQMQAYVDYSDSSCPNAFYRGDNKNIYFCPATDYARESDVIYHEYTHGIVDHIPNYPLPYQDEAGAIDEGIADYFAATKNGDPTIGEGVGTIRTITNVVNYGNKCNRETSSCAENQYWQRSTSPDINRNDYGYVHHNSLVVSGSLWNLRQNQGLSASYVDRLTFDTLILRKPLNFTELLNGLIAQGGTSRESQIKAAFATRGVGSSGNEISVGQGAPNPQLFIDAFNRNNLSQYVTLPPVNTVHRWDCTTCDPGNASWGKGLIQDFNGNDGATHDALMRADTNTNFVALIYGGMWVKFNALGQLNYNAVNSRMLGYPIADRNCSDYNAQCFTDAQLISPFNTSYHYQRFQGGALVLHKSGARLDQTYEVHGPIRARWQELGGPGSGSYGLPIADEYAWQGKRRSDFEGGSICFNPVTNQTEPGCITPVTTRTLTVASANPASGVSITASPNDNSNQGGGVTQFTRIYNNGTVVNLSAPASAGGNSFQKWQRDGADFSSSQSVSVTMDANRALTAIYVSPPAQVLITVQTNPAGRAFTVDGSNYTAPQTFNWVPGSSHTIGTTSPQTGGTGVQYVWGGWNDGGGMTHAVSPSVNTNYTVSFATQYFLTMNAGSGGTVSPQSGWFVSGQNVSISAAPQSSFSFGSWSGSGTGSYTGSANPASVTMNGPVVENGNFSSNPCLYSVSPSSRNFTSASGTGSVSVTAGGGCAWGAASNATWISITGAANGSGSGTISYSITANPNAVSRTGTLTVAGQTHTVTQGAGTCAYSISSSGQSVTAAAANGNISVSANAGCNWTAASNSSFITVTSGSSGTGAGTVGYSVAANTTITGRTGTITIAGQTFTVTQAAASGGCATTAINLGQTANGTLSTTDCLLQDGSHYDAYTFSGVAGQQVAVTMSADFDSYLLLLAPDGTTLATDDDGGGGSNSRIPAASGLITLPASGTYTVLANSFSANATGSYTLNLVGAIPAVAFQFSASNFSVSEGAGGAAITVTRTGDVTRSVTVAYSTMDDPAPVRCDDTVNNHGVAYARCDYSTTLDTLNFAAGETSKTFAVPLTDDAFVEGSEIIQLRLSNPNGATLGSQDTAMLTLTDNDAPGGTNPIYTTPFFVRMQYLDFLSREPEAGEPWSAVLSRCPNVDNDPSCDRILVSQSFFGSPEFRLKGFFVFNFYKVAFNRLPAYAEVITDMRGVTGQSPAETFDRRAAYPISFAARQEFKNLYDALSNAAYVNTLLDRYQLQQVTTPDPTNPEGGVKVTLTRADLINRLAVSGALSLSRAQVLRAIVESNEVGAAEFNRAFVAMQYYGYLRRAPEADGYNAWLRVINEDPNNIRIMVNGFMNSPEYRLRFGQP
jgi:Zn-dependent metalloprotease